MSDLKETKVIERSFSCSDEVLVASWEFEILKGKSVLKFQELELEEVVITPRTPGDLASELFQDSLNSYSPFHFHWRLRLTYRNKKEKDEVNKLKFLQFISAVAGNEQVCIEQDKATGHVIKFELEARTLFLLSLVKSVKSLSHDESLKSKAVRAVCAVLIVGATTLLGIGLSRGGIVTQERGAIGGYAVGLIASLQLL